TNGLVGRQRLLLRVMEPPCPCVCKPVGGPRRARVLGPSRRLDGRAGDAGVTLPSIFDGRLAARPELQDGGSAGDTKALLDMSWAATEGEEAKWQPQRCVQAPSVSVFHEQQERCELQRSALLACRPGLSVRCRHCCRSSRPSRRAARPLSPEPLS